MGLSIEIHYKTDHTGSQGVGLEWTPRDQITSQVTGGLATIVIYTVKSVFENQRPEG